VIYHHTYFDSALEKANCVYNKSKRKPAAADGCRI